MEKRRIVWVAAFASLVLAVVLLIGGRSAQAVAAGPLAYGLDSADVVYADADAYVTAANADGNYGGDIHLLVAHSNRLRAESLLHFDVSKIPLGAVISNATLWVYHERASGSDPLIEVHHITGRWGEMSVTWNNRPSHGLDSYASVVVGSTAGWISWDVTKLVQEWVNGGLTNYGLKLLSNSTSEFGRYFGSKEGQWRPYIVVNWSRPTLTPTPTLTFTPTATPTRTPTRTATPTPRPCPDNYEPNDSFDQAPFLLPNTEYWAAICTRQDVDYYGISVAAGQHIRAEIWNLPADFDLDLYGPDRILIKKSTNSGTSPEVIDHDATVGGPYYIRVYGKDGAFDPDDMYFFKVTLRGEAFTPTPTATIPPRCPDPYEPNNDFANAWLLTPPGSYQSYICCIVGAVDQDYFKFHVNTGERIEVSLSSLPANYDLCLYTPSRSLVQCSTNPGTTQEYIEYIAQETGDYYVYVFGWQGACDSTLPYVLTIRLTRPTPTETSTPTRPYTPTATPTHTPTYTPTRGYTPTNTPTRTRTPSPTPIVPTIHAFLSLHGEDAAEGVVVNKVVGDASGLAGSTKLDIVAKVLSWSPAGNVSVILTVPGDLFGSPVAAWGRVSSGGTTSALSVQNLGAGRYKITTSLSPVSIGWFTWYYKQIVWRFEIPDNTMPQTVVLQAELQVPGYQPTDATGTARVKILKSAHSLILVNRHKLYDEYNEGQVVSLLQQVYSMAQGWPYNTTPIGVVYNVDDYHNSVRNWDNTTVNYTSEATANQVANLIASLIKDWHDDATEYLVLSIPFVGPIPIPMDVPHYLLIVGDDNVIPFYRYNDPSDDEGVALFDCNGDGVKEHPGWCTDSTPNTAIHATDHDYILTDNAYADIWGDNWRTGDVDLWAGRLVGDTAADMLTLLNNGRDVQPGTGRAVLASVDGWELGYEPDDGREGEIADLYNVPRLLSGKGFQVLNDTESPRTIDVMGSYPSNWNTGFRSAANGGMDIFFIGGHDHYDHASIPGDDFSPDDTPGQYTRFDDDHPLTLIVGCHGGLPVPDVDVPGGVNHDMVYDAAHEGARAFIGATGFSYGSPNNLHKCTWAERLLQLFFRKLTLPPGVNSMAIGKALADAKNDYVFGFGGSDGLDRKTVTEFQLYGLPWTCLLYPGGGGAGTESPSTSLPREMGQVERGAVTQVSASVYQQTFTVNVLSYSVAQETQGDIVYDIISVPGGQMDLSEDYPVLPFIQGFTMTLPFSATVQNVELIDADSNSIGTYNVPILQVEPWSEGGPVYTTTTSINYPYPTELIRSQQVGGKLLFTLFPVQHNPSTDQTWFYSRFQVRVTYEAPIAVGVTEARTDKPVYKPGEDVRVTASIVNADDAAAILSATLTIEDWLGEVKCQRASSAFEVAAGSTYQQEFVCSGLAEEGAYLARVILWQSGSPVGGASAPVVVQGGAITALSGPTQVAAGQSARFQVTYANYRSTPVSAEFRLSIQDADGSVIQELDPSTRMVPGDGSQVVSFAWTPGDEHVGREFQAVAFVTVQGQTVGPRTWSFGVSSAAMYIYLPIILRNAP